MSFRRSRLIAIAAGLAIATASLLSTAPASAHESSHATPTLASALTFSVNTTPTVTSTGLKKHVNAAKADVSPTASTVKYQWYRDSTKISGATSMDYTLTGSDYAKTITVKVSYSKSGYTTLTQANAPGTAAGQWWLKATPAEPQVTGDGSVGGTLSIAPRTYVDVSNGNAVVASPGLKYQWYSGSTAISSSKGGTAATYTVKSTDKGKSITVKVTASGASTILPSVSTTVATPFVGTAPLPNWDVAAPALNVSAGSTDFATSIEPADTGITSPDVTDNALAYQWQRDGASIKNAVGETYLLAQADRGHHIGVRITTSHGPIGSTTYTSAVTYSQVHDYSSLPSSTPVIYTQDGPAYAVGSKIDVGLPSSVDADLTPIPGSVSVTHQWKRDGAVIPVAQGGTDLYYMLKAADVGASMSVDATVGRVGFIPYTYTTTATSTVPRGTIVGTSGANPTVTTNGSGDLVANTGSAGNGSTTADGTPAATWDYQWLRNGVDIEGATGQTYTLVAADNGFNINVRATAVLPGYTSAGGLESTPIDYSIAFDGNPSHVPYVSTNHMNVGAQLGVYGTDHFLTKDGPYDSPTFTTQWLRNTVPIANETGLYYVVQPADVGTLLTARVTITKPGYAPLVIAIAQTTVVAKGVTDPGAVVVVEPNGVGVLKARVDFLAPATPTPSYKYQWYRGTTKISGATKSTYKLTSSDYKKLISVQLTMTRSNFTGPTVDVPLGLPNPTIFPRTTGVDYSIRGDGKPDLTPHSPTSVKVGDTLTATPPPFFESDGTTPLVDVPTLTYTWYRGTTAISGQHADTYVVQSADKGKKVNVKVTAALPGRLARTTGLSNTSATVGSGVISLNDYAPVPHLDLSTRKATLTFAGTSTTPGPFMKTYAWYRNGSKISGATSSSYTLASTDTNKSITVVITLAKNGYTSKKLPALLVNGITPSLDVVTVTGPVSGEYACVAPFYYRGDGTQLLAGTNAGDTQAIQWVLDGSPIDGATDYNYTPVGASGQTLTCTVTVGATLHKSRVDTSPTPVLLP